MATYDKTFSVKNGLSVANTVVLDTSRNLSNIANANVDELHVSSYGPVVNANGYWLGVTPNVVTTSNSAPSPALPGSLWWDADVGSMFVYYDDGSSAQWVEVTGGVVGPQGPAGDNGVFTVSETAPVTPANGEVWWSSNTGKSYIYYNDGSSSQWVLLADPETKGDSGVNFWTLDIGDETTNITTGTKKTIRAPFALTLTDIPRASLANASTSGAVTVDINVSGTSVLGANKLTIDQDEKTSTTAATPTSIATSSVADDAEITIDIDGAGTNAKGLKVTLYFNKV